LEGFNNHIVPQAAAAAADGDPAALLGLSTSSPGADAGVDAALLNFLQAGLLAPGLLGLSTSDAAAAGDLSAKCTVSRNP
jgi:hypothetical protein